MGNLRSIVYNFQKNWFFNISSRRNELFTIFSVLDLDMFTIFIVLDLDTFTILSVLDLDMFAIFSVLDLDAFERNNKAEGLGVTEGAAQAKNLQDTELTCKLFRFLQLLCEGHNLGTDPSCLKHQEI